MKRAGTASGDPRSTATSGSLVSSSQRACGMGELCAARLTVNPESLSDQDAVVSLLAVLRFFAEGADLWLDKALLHVRIRT